MDSETLVTTLPALSTLTDDHQQAILARVKKVMDEPRRSASGREEEEENQTEHTVDVEIPSMLEWMLQMENGTRTTKLQRVPTSCGNRSQKGDRDAEKRRA
jgi:hypothetical protein